MSIKNIKLRVTQDYSRIGLSTVEELRNAKILEYRTLICTCQDFCSARTKSKQDYELIHSANRYRFGPHDAQLQNNTIPTLKYPGKSDNKFVWQK